MEEQSLSRTIARNVRAIRLQKGLRQQDLADSVGGSLSRLALSTVEQGTRAVKIDELPGLCRELGVGLEDLMAGSNDLPSLFRNSAGSPAPSSTLADFMWAELEPRVRSTVRATLREALNA